MPIGELASILGGFGDFIASIAVLITLVYLAVQVRHAKHQVSLIGLQARANHATAVLAPIINSDLAGIFAKIDLVDYGDFGLTKEESVRFGAWFHTWLQTEQGSFYLLPEGANDPLLAWMLSTRAGVEFWERNKGIYDPDFVARVEMVREQMRLAPKSSSEVLAGPEVMGGA
jgi:hypothetical protein